MHLIKNIKKEENDVSGEVYFPLFNSYIGLEYQDSIPMEYIKKCAEYLNTLSEETISTICKYSLDFCRDVISYSPDVDYTEELIGITLAKDILKFIEPVALTIDEPDDINICGINLYCRCAWDQDNDMQILINNNNVVYIGTFDGLDAWQKNLSDWGNYITGYRLCDD
ncbi:hypothetical protein J2T13_005297 [Paenibacillus sp. DS2015]|uniref:DUF6985 domain-containing protein n=1 Tax=Paenibacillus sp. DS2015 TaxID=3373917 RepID=UPI003D201D6B